MSLVGLLGASVSSMFYASKLSCGGYFPAPAASTYETADSTYRSRHSAPVRLSSFFSRFLSIDFDDWKAIMRGSRNRMNDVAYPDDDVMSVRSHASHYQKFNIVQEKLRTL